MAKPFPSDNPFLHGYFGPVNTEADAAHLQITGENPYEVPMRIYPAIHYTMGGLWVDYNLMSTIPGLHVLGEANFSDHGANRLGARPPDRQPQHVQPGDSGPAIGGIGQDADAHIAGGNDRGP